jgi:bifunctional UDP-N-acetylglucosamine pyrophosphorylase / glucosamine-1-phosphate N-acetyltransferase
MKPITIINQLVQKGVRIPNPESVEIGEEICLERVAGKGVTIFAGSKLYGKETLICEGAQIGFEGPATVINCYVGPQVALKGGFFQEAVFLERARCGLGAHVRQGSILEEQASVAHTVGLKHTILFPFVTLGSLINFCDCLMAGGTSRKNHSEVGSSYIHFNFTPNQDKATPSLMGDVPRGVMLNQSPIFLGGQGGLVGPCQLAFGTVVAAGTICRKDHLKENHLVMESGPRSACLPFKPGGYLNLRRILNHNINYVANLIALWHWYRDIRGQFIGPDFQGELADGLNTTLKKGISERIKQLEKLKEKVNGDGVPEKGIERIFCSEWPQVRDILQNPQAFEGPAQFKDRFFEAFCQQIGLAGKNYIKVVTNLSDSQASMGSQWLQGIVDQVSSQVSAILEAQ